MSLGVPAATRGWKRERTDFPHPPESVEEACLDFRLLASKLVREQTSVVASHRVSGHLLQQPQTANTNLETSFAYFPLIPS